MTNTLKKRTVSSLAWKAFERGGSATISLVVQIVLARLLAPDDFGALAIMLVFIRIGNVIVASGLNTALVQSPNADDRDFTTVFWMSSAISVALYIIGFFAAPAIANFYGIAHLKWPLRVLLFVLIINAYCSVQVAYVARSLEFRKTFLATISSILISGVVGVGLAFAGVGLWALVCQQLVYALINCAVLAIMIPWRPSFSFDKDRARELFGFGWKLLVSGLLETGYQSLSDLIIGKQFTATQLGFSSQGNKYPQALAQTLDGSIQPVMLSAVAKVQDDLSYVKRLVRRALKTSSYLIMPLMTLFALTAEPIVCLLLGDKWLPSVWFMQVYCMTYALWPIHTSNLQALNAIGRSDLFLKLELIKKAYGVCLMLFGAFVLHDIYWMVGLSFVASVISTFVNAYPNKRVIGYSYSEQMRDIFPGVALSLVSAAIAWPFSFLGLSDIWLIVVQASVMSASYIGLSKLFRVEALEYLLLTGKELLQSRSGS